MAESARSGSQAYRAEHARRNRGEAEAAIRPPVAGPGLAQGGDLEESANGCTATRPSTGGAACGAESTCGRARRRRSRDLVRRRGRSRTRQPTGAKVWRSQRAWRSRHGGGEPGRRLTEVEPAGLVEARAGAGRGKPARGTRPRVGARESEADAGLCSGARAGSRPGTEAVCEGGGGPATRISAGTRAQPEVTRRWGTSQPAAGACAAAGAGAARGDEGAWAAGRSRACTRRPQAASAQRSRGRASGPARWGGVRPDSRAHARGGEAS